MLTIKIRNNNYDLKNIIDENCIYIFTHGFCGNFAYVLHNKFNSLSLGYIYNKKYFEIDHWFLYDKTNNLYYDIRGKQTHECIILNMFGNYEIYKYLEFCYDITYEEYDNIGLWDHKYDSYVYEILDDYIEKNFPLN